MKGVLTETEERVMEMARQQGVLRSGDLRRSNIHPQQLSRMCDKGLLIRVGHGLYERAEADVTIHHGLVMAIKAVPRSTICLLSALVFHELGTENPHKIWIAVDNRAAQPTIAYPPLRVFRFSGKALTEGIEQHEIEGVNVPIYCPAKSVADCFKYRKKIGTDIALEALRECRRQRKATSDELWRYARVCRVAEVMRPYLEATA